MAFYSPDASMDQILTRLLEHLADDPGASPASSFSITWVRYPASLLADGRSLPSEAAPQRRLTDREPPLPRGQGSGWLGACLRDPGDLVQLAYLMAAERWLQRDMLEEEPELRRALEAMTRRGSHEATSYVVDRLSGTTSGPSQPPQRQATWEQQRRLVNGWLASLGWEELEGCSAMQKTWQDGPYGRDRDLLGEAMQNANRFSSDALARLLQALFSSSLVSPPACQRMRSLLQVERFAAGGGAARPTGLMARLADEPRVAGRLWGQARLSPAGAQLAVYAEPEGLPATLLVVLAEGGMDTELPSTLLQLARTLLLHQTARS